MRWHLVGVVVCLLDMKNASAQSAIPAWTNCFNGSSNSLDSAQAIAVDRSGNVFVAGYSGTASTPPYGYDYATVAYSSAGVPLWTNRYNGAGSAQAYALAVDCNGDVFVTGTSAGSGTSFDYATIKYSGTGVPLWTNRYNGTANSGDQANAVAVDGSGNVIVTGTASDSGSSFDYATIKYSGAGVPLWTNRFDGPANAAEQATGIAVDAGGNVFVTGYSYDARFITTDYATVAYSRAGVPLWTNLYDGVGAADFARAVAVDASGNVIVTGESAGAAGGNDYVTIKYSGSGVPLWTNRFDGPANAADYPTAVAVDVSGNVIVTGRSRGTTSRDDFATVAYSPAGLPLWTNRYDGPISRNDGPQTSASLAIGPDGAVYVTGLSEGSTASVTTTDYAIIKYSSEVVVPLIRLYHEIVGNLLTLRWSNDTFRLQSAPSVQGQFTNITGATSPSTNLLSEPQRYFRLKAD